MTFGKLKALLRTAAECTILDLVRRIGRITAAFRRRECRNVLRQSGYVQT
jgi:hypothetical protein